MEALYGEYSHTIRIEIEWPWYLLMALAVAIQFKIAHILNLYMLERSRIKEYVIIER